MEEIALDELKRRLEDEDRLEIVDIREAAEHEAWHIAGSRNLPVYNALRLQDPSGLVQAAKALPRDRPLVTVCRAGIMSLQAAAVLRSIGFEAFSLQGGMRGWSEAWSRATVVDTPFRLIQIRRNGKGCLSYMIADGEEVIVVDPCIDAGVYVELADEMGARITQVVETHVHADHISRARALADTTGAALCLPRNDRVTFDYQPIDDEDLLSVGSVSVRAIRTPGHTGESTCYQVGDDWLLSGDTVFVGAVGRPDLEKGDAGARRGAEMLYGSLTERILQLAETVTILPTHHAGEILFDGIPVATTLRELRSELPLLTLDQEAFVGRVVDSLQGKPGNFETIIGINEGRLELGDASPLDLEAGPNRCAAG
ncbi:MAG: MBL fold metallo-hydrolase [Acidobacteriota bacterium]|nr:MBL fold metallo-hydrolase [Acidobacteriota bacterium]MDH3785433.1 MBL fold metallo-hydrolase [Acidobacteriota bacterium]